MFPIGELLRQRAVGQVPSSGRHCQGRPVPELHSQVGGGGHEEGCQDGTPITG